MFDGVLSHYDSGDTPSESTMKTIKLYVKCVEINQQRYKISPIKTLNKFAQYVLNTPERRQVVSLL